MSTATGKLIKMLEQIGRIIGEKDSREESIDRAWDRVASGNVYYKTDYDKDRAEPLAKLVAEQVRSEGRRLCEQEKREWRERTVLELEALRSELPNLAARASVELGQLARELRERAND